MLKGMLSIACLLATTSLVQAGPSLHTLLTATDSRQVKAPVLRQWARAKDAKKRAQVAIFYGRMQHPEAVMPLMILLQDSSPQVRSAAAFGLGLLGWRNAWTGAHRPHVINALKSRLSDPNRRVVGRALEALAKYGPDDLEQTVQPLLKKAPASVQVEALRALFRGKVRQRSRHPKKKVSHVSPATLKLLKGLAASPSPQVRRHVAYYFARIKDPRGLGILLLLAQDKALWTRYFALFALRKLASPKAVKVALASVGHKSYIVRVAAIQAVAAGKGAAGLPSKLAQDPSFHVRAALAAAYGSLKKAPGKALVAQLHRWRTSDPYMTVRSRALASLAQLFGKTQPDQVEAWLKEALTHRSWVLREAAVQASRQIKKRQAAFLNLAAKDKDPRVRAAVVLALGKHKTTAAFDALKKALESPHLAIRGYAVSAMTKRKEKDAPALLWATYKRSSASKWIELREEIIKALVGRKKTPVAWLKAAAKDPAAAVATMAIGALKKRDVQSAPKAPVAALTYSPHRHLANAYLTRPNAAPPVIVLKTNRGAFEITTTPQAAPIHVANLVSRVKQGLYNGLGWHRVISNFVIQGGDPDGSGWGDGGYQLRAEINRQRYRRGTLGMPRAMGWNTGSVQLFFTHTPTPHLDGRYTVFGHVTKGLDVIDKIEKGDQIINAYVKGHATSQPASR